MKSFLNILSLVFIIILISSCNYPKSPHGIYLVSSRDTYGIIDFHSGGTGRHNLFGKEEPFRWKVDRDTIFVDQSEGSVRLVFRWDSNDLILLGPNLRLYKRDP